MTSGNIRGKHIETFSHDQIYPITHFVSSKAQRIRHHILGRRQNDSVQTCPQLQGFSMMVLKAIRQGSYRTVLLRGLCLGLIYSLLPTSLILASTYRCEDSSGITVLTDSPAQLDKCALLFDDSTSISQTTSSHMVTGSQAPNSIEPSSEEEQREETRALEQYEAQDTHPDTDTGQEVIIPVTPYGGSLLVTVQLNQTREARLILDTGATMTVLSNDVALDLGLIASTNTRLTTVNTAGGQVQVNVTKVSSIQAGAAQVKNVDVAIHDLPDGPSGIDGLLGMSFLNHFLVTLDTNQGQLHLKPRS